MSVALAVRRWYVQWLFGMLRTDADGGVCPRCGERLRQKYAGEPWVCVQCGYEDYGGYMRPKGGDGGQAGRYEGLCHLCRRRPADPGYRMCGTCRARRAEQKRRQRGRMRSDCADGEDADGAR